MASRKKRDPNADTARLVTVLCDEPDCIFENAGVGNLGHRAGVPKGILRRRLEGHPNVTIHKIVGKYKFQYKP